MDQCEATNECEQLLAFIVDCDECKNIFVCANHVGTVINTHAEYCQETLHVDRVGGEHDSFRRRNPDNQGGILVQHTRFVSAWRT